MTKKYIVLNSVLSLFLVAQLLNCKGQLTEETAKLTFAPEVPPPITRSGPARVKVEIETVEKVMKLADGVEYTF